MANTSFDKPNTAIPKSSAPVVLRILLALILSLPGLAGLIIIAGLIGEWAYRGFDIHDPNGWGIPFFAVVAMILVSFSVITIGVILRFARWKGAPKMSLVLAILSAMTIAIGYVLLSVTATLTDVGDRTNALMLSIVALVLVSAPPLRHWWNAKKAR